MSKNVFVVRATARAPRGARAGSAMLAALFVVMLVAVLSVSYLQLSLNKNREQKTGVDAKRAFYIAEAGLSEAVAGLAMGKSGNVGSPSLPAKYANGVFWVTAEDAGPSRTSLTSTGLCGSGRAAVAVLVERSSEEVSKLGVFANDGVVVGNGALIDSYDSRVGTYETQHAIQPAELPTGSRVGSNADITVGSTGLGLLGGATTAIYGDARPGPTGTVLRGASAVITGSTAPNGAAIELPSIEIPELVCEGDVTAISKRPVTTIPSGEHALGTLYVSSTGKAVITGPATLVVDQLVVDAEGVLRVDTTAGPVTIYVKNYMALQAGSTYSSSSTDPADVTLLVNASQSADRNGDGVNDPPMRFLSAGKFYGSIYAPQAHVDVPAALELYGALTAASITLKASAKVHFDEAFAAVNFADGGMPAVVAWRIVDLPASTLVSVRYDPEKVLEACGIVPRPAADSHFDPGVTPPPDTLPAPGLIPGLLKQIFH